MVSTESSEGGSGEINRFVYVATAIAALNGLLFGFDTGIISGALPFIGKTFQLSSFMKELVVSGALIGAIVGAAGGGRLTDDFGRRKLIFVASIIFFVGSLIMAFAPSVPILVVGRFTVGFGIGVASLIGPLYNSEIAPSRLRGSLVSLNQLAVTSGILLAYFVNYAFAQGGQWRWMLGMGVVPAAVLGIGMIWMPKSPRYLVRIGEEEEARDILKRIRPSADVDEELDDIRKTEKEQSGTGLGELLESWIRPALIVGAGLAVFQQITGINTVIYYAPTIFNSTGFASSASILATVGVGVVNVSFTLAAVFLLDRRGRRPLLLVGLGGMTAMLFGLGGVFYFQSLQGIVGLLSVVGVMAYVAFFAIGLGPVFWLLISEIYPLEVRGTAMGLVTVLNWAANLAVSISFLTLTNAIGKSFTFWLYGALSIVTFVFAYYLVPETKGRSLEAIESDLRSNSLTGSSEEATEQTVQNE
ncbi:sugar porter family MFS transporter [Haladaptatus sp. CMAA 1911]|uniref:sugar porter family MFS transporter n=1 Tax=unclassified Haladaptatus TaxID=2622732 RepID=UPI003754915C